MKVRVYLISAAAMLLCAGLHAQTALTFEEALEKCLSSNPVLEAAGYEEMAAAQERRAAFGLRLPRIDVTGAYVHMGDDIAVDFNSLKQPAGNLLESLTGSGIQLPPAVLEQAAALLGRNWGYTLQERDLGFVGGSVTLPIYTGGKINAANRAARINERTAKEKGNQTRNALVSELVERYYGLSLAIQAVKVREQVYEAMRSHLGDARALEENGMIPRSERLYMEVKAAEAERDLHAARLQEQTLRDALANTLNEPGGEFEPVSRMFVLDNLPGADYFKEMAVRGNPLLKQVGLKRELAVEGVRAKRAEFLPQVAAMGGMSLYRYRVSEHMPEWAIGIGVKFNIFDGLARERKYSAARYSVRQVEALEVKAGNDVATLVGKLYNEMDNYRDRIRSVEKSLEFAEEHLRVRSIAFLEGAATAADVTDAELILAAALIDRLQTAYYYGVMLARLLEAAGAADTFTDYLRRPDTRFIGLE